MNDIIELIKAKQEDKGFVLTEQIIKDFLIDNIDLLVKEVKEEIWTI